MFSGCTDFPVADPFARLYGVGRPVSKETASPTVAGSSDLLTLSACNLPLSVFCRLISDRFGVGVVYSPSVAGSLVTAEFKESDLSSVLDVVSRCAGCDVVKLGNTFFIGSPRPDDLSFLVKVIYGDSSAVIRSVECFLSSRGKCSFCNGVLLVTDSESVLRRVSECLEYLDSSVPTYVLQLYFIDVKKDSLKEGGLSVTPSGRVAFDCASGSVDFDGFGFEAFFNANFASNSSRLCASPTILCRDNLDSVMNLGSKVPVPRKSVSDSGTVTTSGYDYIETGFIVKAKINRSKIGGLLSLSVTQSAIVSYVDYIPVVSQNVFAFSADLLSDQIYLLGEITRNKESFSSSQVSFFSGSSDYSSTQIWGRLYCIGAPIKKLVQ